MMKKERKSYNNIDFWSHSAIDFLAKMIAVPSLSRQEDNVAKLIQSEIESFDIKVLKIQNNVIAFSKNFDQQKPSIILNSHHDTVPANSNYTKDPLKAIYEDGKLYGLGSNDAGGCLTSLIHCFIALYEHNLKYNLILIASAEEEISGKNGIEAVFNSDQFKNIYTGHQDDFAIVGEPTLMQMAVAERGLMVVDAVCEGVAGHAAREEGISALYKAIDDISKIRSYEFPKNSELLGPVKTSVTVINTENKAHNVVPNQCQYVIDCRINEQYTFTEILETLQNFCSAKLTPRSMRLKSSMIALDHPIVKTGLHLGKTFYGSPTTSDKALIPITALKIGPGDSARSHSPDEFIFVEEIRQGVEEYMKMILMVCK
jgi:acetylornithine deacetylase